MLFNQITQNNISGFIAFLSYFIFYKRMNFFEILIYRQWKECF